MTKINLLRTLALTLSLSLPALGVAAGPIGFVDMQTILEDSKLGQRLQEQLRAEFEPRGKALGEEEAAIRQLQLDLERDGALMSAEQVKKAESEIETRIQLYQDRGNALQQEVLKVQQAKSREILEPARDSINAVAKDKKLGVIIEPGMAGLLYVDDSLDITQEVIKHMDANTK